MNWKRKNIRINSEYVSHLRLADDIITYSNSPGKLGTMLSGFSKSNINVGLKMNPEKTNVVFNLVTSKIKIAHNNNEINETQSYL